MKKILFFIALVLLFSCEKIDDATCKTCTTHIYSPSGLIPDRIVTNTVCGDDLRNYEKNQRSPLCNDCRVVITCR